MFINVPLSILLIESDEDREFMTNLYIEKRELMYRVAHYYSGSILDTEDAVSESCLGLIRRINQLKQFGDSELEAYIVATVRNAVRMIYRKRSANVEQSLTADLDLADHGPDTDEIVLAKWSVDELSAGIRKLSPDDQSLITMRYFQGYSDKEIATLLKIREGAVRTRLFRSKLRLQRILEDGNDVGK